MENRQLNSKINFLFYRKKISSLGLEQLKKRFEPVLNVSQNFEVVIEKGNKLQNKLSLNSVSNNLDIYFVDRDTTLTENIFNKYYNNQIKIIMVALLLPLISMAVYLVLYSPNLQDVVTGTESNFMTSGGFGPNQVATVLGLGVSSSLSFTSKISLVFFS